MKIDPLSLRLFIAVMEENTIAAAAARQSIAASAASRRLAELEHHLRVPLFIRSNKGMEPTPAAFALLNLARTVLNDLDSIGAQMRSYGRGMLGQVRVAANISAITQFLPAQLKSFMTQYPGVQVLLDEQISTQVAQSVLNNTVDLGILNQAQYGCGLQLIDYRTDELVLVVPRGHPLATAGHTRVPIAEALAYDFVGAHLGSAINNQLIMAAAQANMALNMRIHVTSFDALCLMVSAGLGVGVLPAAAAQLYVRALDLQTLPLAEAWAHRRLMLCVRSGASRTPATDLLIEHLRLQP